jgi:hypothetical protein
LHAAEPVDYESWQNFQRWLGVTKCQVVVPFAVAMVELIPPVAVRLRRDVGQIICAIQAHALLHRDRRDHNDAGQIVADIDHDYETVRQLMNAIIAEGSGVAVSPAITETIDAIGKATIGMAEGEGANAKDIAKLLKLDRTAAWRRLSAACHDGYVVNLEQRRGMPGKYRTTAQKPEPVPVLPAAPELAERFNTTQCPDTPLKSTQPCNRDEIADVSLGDNGCTGGCKPVAECTEPNATMQPDATGIATDNSLYGNAKSLPVARLHEFPGDTPPTEDFPPVCIHCGAPATADAPVQLCAVEGKEYLLHRACQKEWLDLSIPPSLRRTGAA